jgi:hypothetical protein
MLDVDGWKSGTTTNRHELTAVSQPHNKAVEEREKRRGGEHACKESSSRWDDRSTNIRQKPKDGIILSSYFPYLRGQETQDIIIQLF